MSGRAWVALGRGQWRRWEATSCWEVGRQAYNTEKGCWSQRRGDALQNSKVH